MSALSIKGQTSSFAHMTEEFSVLSTDVITTIIRSIHRNLKNKFGGSNNCTHLAFLSEVVSVHHTATHGSDWS